MKFGLETKEYSLCFISTIAPNVNKFLINKLSTTKIIPMNIPFYI